MKKWKKRSLALLCTAVMTFSCTAFGMTAFAYDGEFYDDYDEEYNPPLCEYNHTYFDISLSGFTKSYGYEPDGFGEYTPRLSGATRPATLEEDGLAVWYCSTCRAGLGSFTVPKIEIKSIMVSNNEDRNSAQEKTSYSYTGNEIRPFVHVFLKNKIPAAREGSPETESLLYQTYKVSYKNNVNIGTATAIVEFTGKLYQGTVTKDFQIYMLSPTVVNAKKGFKITWQKQAKATGYEVWRSADNGKTYTKAKTLKGNSATTFTNTNDAANINGRKYKYKIRPIIPGGTGGFSRVKTCYKVARPSKPKVINTKKGFRISWTKDKKASGYEIWRSDNSGKSYLKAKTIKNPNTTSFRNTALAANQNGWTYLYKMISDC